MGRHNKKRNIGNILLVVLSASIVVVTLIAIGLDIYARIIGKIDQSTFWSIFSAICSIVLTFAAILYTVISGFKLDKKIESMAIKIEEWQKQKPEIEQTLAEINSVEGKPRTKAQDEKLKKHEENLRESLKSFLDD
ncbi:MAG: hypothetical protein HDT32_03895 [Clostridiales bacterium]|nr:hypothetical protein [Clostridiales bacterium]